MAGVGLTDDRRWFEAQCAGAPGPLRERAAHYFLTRDQPGRLPERLGASAQVALGAVLASSGDRSVALDLLAADALVTLALKAQARAGPAELDRFAAELLGD